MSRFAVTCFGSEQGGQKFNLSRLKVEVELYAIALLLTLFTELLIGWLWLTFAGKKVVPEIQSRVWLLAIMGVNLISHPIAYEMYSNGLLGYWPLELAVVVFEGVLIAWMLRIQFSWALLFSLIANATSAALGWVVFPV